VAGYLQLLESASAGLARGRRTELVAEIRGHIDDALLEAGAADEVTIRNVLERLGPPEEIAAAAGPARKQSGRLELAAVLVIAVPFIGWIVGSALVAASRAWTGREKAFGIAICLIPAAMMFFAFVAVGASSGSDVSVGTGAGISPEEQGGGGDGGLGPTELLLVLGSFLAGPLAAVYLGTRLRRTPEPDALASA